MNKLTIFGITALAFAMSACGGGSSTSSDSGTPNVGHNGSIDVANVALDGAISCDVPQFAQKLLAEINAVRAQPRNCGTHNFGPTASLGWNSMLADAAASHTMDMAAENYYSSTNPSGEVYSDRITDAGYKFSYAGEVLALLNGDVTANNAIPRAMAAWLADPGHCAALKSSVFDEVGASCVKVGKKAYFTVDLGGL